MSGWLFTYAPLVALCVSILALSASFLSLGWNIYRDVVLKPRLKVAFGIKSMLREDEEYRLSEMGPPLLILEITNHGPGEVVCSGAVAKTESFAFLRSLFGKLSYRFITPDFKHPLCFRLPYRIVVGEKSRSSFRTTKNVFLRRRLCGLVSTIRLTTKRFPSPRCASAIQIVRPLQSTVATQPQLHPALLRLSAMIPQYFNDRDRHHCCIGST